MSLKSVALCWSNSSGICANISAVCSKTWSTAISAVIFSATKRVEICSSIIGSRSIWICPLRISASFLPTVTSIFSAIWFVISTNFSMASWRRLISLSVSVTFLFSMLISCSSIITTFPIPIPSEPAIPLYIILPLIHQNSGFLIQQLLPLLLLRQLHHIRKLLLHLS